MSLVKIVLVLSLLSACDYRRPPVIPDGGATCTLVGVSADGNSQVCEYGDRRPCSCDDAGP